MTLPWRRQPGQQRTVGQLFVLVFMWTLVSVGVAAAIGTAGAFLAGHPEVARAVMVAAGAVMLSSVITTLTAVLDGVSGAFAAATAYILKILVIAALVAVSLNLWEIDGHAVIAALVVMEIVSLITMSLVVFKAEGPGFDLPERDKGEN
ncbi:MAG: hypothetical protein QM705_06900 [Ancrocorticia sp.]